ncbi:MAG TPA: hypothetical protein DEG17_03355 [Cyanobacteria bacterium UBA11149]|nr:hypothetical protein [Cyanobacteria bacterium UBA11367]HBE61058.1 hypothetical protein [Cyanobacteria bacterium UBA11366]HBK62279.1 hypothetical protein [Cyanobacteria bacterium UBA11166]HBR74243.1 hypothetical protein [Cyanobacteria bacterium UBA11159]HBS69860.1 hypothetical protein [Cyanobacteria bacterium UBA11153]HBW87944.1 hypothetical protein [Cyanobacteria bacterium UBA11149]HCA95024.1 hypothetical protein [Cyanobacteria bacterium UBA9226]
MAAAKKKELFWMDMGDDNVVEMRLSPSNYDAGLRNELGITQGAKPEGKNLIGTGREAAILAGAIPLTITYKVGQNSRSANILCSPVKIGTALRNNGIKGKTYKGKEIDKCYPPRKRKIVVG